MKKPQPTLLGRRQINTRPNEVQIDPRLAVDLQTAGRREQAQQMARRLLAENADLLKLLGALIERLGGHVDVDAHVLNDPRILFELERYDSVDGLEYRYVAKRVAG